MSDVLLMLHRRSLSEGLCHIFERRGMEHPIVETVYDNVFKTAERHAPKVILLEVPVVGAPSVYGCLGLADALKETLPLCKILLMCSELDANAVEASIRAQQARRVDGFIFFDTSIEFLAASVKALL